MFNTGPVELISRRNVHFVTINSMAMEMDGCFLCHTAKLKLNIISSKLKDIILISYNLLNKMCINPNYFRAVKMQPK